MKRLDDGVSVDEPRLDRRNLLKLGVAGTAAALASAVPVPASASIIRDDGFGVVFHDSFPQEVSPDYKRFNQYNTIFKSDRRRGIPAMKPIWDNDRPGFTGSDYAMSLAASTLWQTGKRMGPQSMNAIYEPGKFSLPTPHKFPDAATAHAQIKRVARMFGANVVGITRRDERWDYSHVVDPLNEKKVTPWEEHYKGFNPKTVIVVGTEMDYEALAAAPSQTADATMLNAYSELTYIVMHLARYFSYMGYRAIPSVNDVAMNVPYAIAAGLGESNRMGMLQNYHYGTRLRIAKVHIELELDEYYDKPVTFGIESFCANCLHCADNCPSKSISRDDRPSIFTAEDVKDMPFINPGVRKWHLNGQKCHDYWIESGSTCGTCLATCPYNKPSFWHHRLIDRVNTMIPGPLHKVMAEMDLWHGYGNMFDEKAPAVFWDPKGRSYNGLLKDY
ncbi:reductive dehalogenase [Parendozoicomonas haliclonae]|uniref:3-chloro-4-hydroxyphenylacetate reductive dehalogenase n=1 Tax=Parendozoicomonas haliclonae TaxID=1960125 RepID=A0A1X7AFT5_9GAMM|nr:reductive dehalogenase [Parendozoicomonas haliclonae]SMA38522.1 3-chloro-4-hydroxyphenylacetate reductive dehalogenase precursor [Parendozoicomonas haliclonae]